MRSNLVTPKKLILFIIFFLLPFPIFLDLSTLTLALEQPTTVGELFNIKLSIPIPVGLLCTMTYLIYSWMHIYRKSKRYTFILKPRVRRRLLFPMLFFLFLSLFSGYELVRIIQLSIPVVIFALLPIPTYSEDRLLMSKYLILGVSALTLLHLTSVAIYNEFTFSEVDRYLGFGTIFGFAVYQSLVSYPAMLMLYGAFIFWYYLHDFAFWGLRHILPFIAVLVIILASVAGLRITLIDALILLITLIILVARQLILNAKINIMVILLPVFLLILVNYSYYMPFFGSYDRLFSLGASDRIDRMGNVTEIVLDDPMIFFLGAGIVHSGAHNFFLDLIAGVGLIGALIYFSMLFFNFYKLLTVFTQADPQYRFLNSIVFINCSCLLALNSIFNSALTQPLYTSSFFMIIVILLGDSIAKPDPHSTCQRKSLKSSRKVQEVKEVSQQRKIWVDRVKATRGNAPMTGHEDS